MITVFLQMFAISIINVKECQLTSKVLLNRMFSPNDYIRPVKYRTDMDNRFFLKCKNSEIMLTRLSYQN